MAEIEKKLSSVVSEMIRLRRWMGHSQKKLSDNTGITRETIARIEQNKTDPRLSTIEDLLLALGYELRVVPLKK